MQCFPLHAVVRSEDGVVSCCCSNKDCKQVGKHPSVAWRDYESSREDWGDDGLGYGIKTGEGFFVVDLDVKHEGEANWSKLIEGHEIPETLTVRTPTGGKHLYFKCPKEVTVRNSASTLAPGVDVRGDGGFVVGPGSPHAKGGVYTIIDKEVEIAQANTWLLKLVNKRPKEAPKGTTVYLDEDHPEYPYRLAAAKRIANEYPPAVEGEAGSNVAYALACKLVVLELPSGALLGALEGWNAKCQPPWSQEELLHKLESANERCADIRGFPSKAFWEKITSLVLEPKEGRNRPLDVKHEYTYIVGTRGKAETSKASLGEVMSDLTDHLAWDGVLSYDIFRDRVVAVRPPVQLDCESDKGLTDEDVTRIRGWFEFHGKKIGATDTLSAVETVARKKPFHPVRDYLNDLVWDGAERLTRVLPDYFQTDETEYELAIGPRWFISLVARVMQPGCQSDSTLILEGLQGVGKTWAYKRLMHDPSWYANSTAGIESKDFYENLRAVWLFSFDELDSLNRGTLTRVKDVLTATVDRFRKSYGRVAQNHPRECGFCGTTNADTYLNDPTGGRRFWPVTVCREIDLEKITTDRDQLWAEAVHRYRAGESWFMETQRLKDLCIEQIEERMQIDPWEEEIKAWLYDPKKVRHEDQDAPQGSKDTFAGFQLYDASRGVTTAAALEYALGKEKAHRTNGDAQRVATAFRRLGWKFKQPVKINGNNVFHYRRTKV